MARQAPGTRRVSRVARQAALVAAARDVRVPATCDVAVVGGGAAGLVAAIVAAETGASAVVLERELECGRTILATGAGRCNFANVDLDPTRYSQPAFVSAVCGESWLEDVLGFFAGCGLRWCEEEGRLYPVSRQAASVRNVLLARATRAGVMLAPGREVRRVAATGQGGSVAYADPDGTERTLQARAVVFATGGGAAKAAEGLGLAAVPCSPVLCPVACHEATAAPFLAALDGRRTHALVSLLPAGATKPTWQERGEVLFRSYGLSGIVSLNLSRRAQPGDAVLLDLAPDVPAHELATLAGAPGPWPEGTGALDGVLDPAVARVLEGVATAEAHPGETPAHALARLAKALPLVAEGPAETNHAQVTRGGLTCDGFDPHTLAAHGLPWLHACGEALDVDADCGGFNLAWAWRSGMVAGQAASTMAAGTHAREASS